MGKVKSKNTKPELLVRKFLFSKGLRFRIHNRKLPGCPDIILKKFSTVILVNGCFWHGHDQNCNRVIKLPKTNTEFWKAKILKNFNKDQLNDHLLKESGWKVITIWECHLKDKSEIENTLNDLYQKLIENSQYQYPQLNQVE